MEQKNIATLETEIYKRDAIAINRLGMYGKLQEMYGTDSAEEYLRQLEEHEIYGGTKITSETVYDDYEVDSFVVFAHWTRNTCTVSFNANGGSCTTASMVMNCGDSVGSLPGATRTYYTFDGWYTQASGGTKIDSSTILDSDTTVYAHWTQNGFGAWSGWSTTAVSSNANREVQTEVRSAQTGTKTTYNYNRYLYKNPSLSYWSASYGSTWATNQGYSGSWQYASSSTRWSVDHLTDGQNVYYGETRDGNHWWYNESVTTEPIYSNVTYYRYRDRIQ